MLENLEIKQCADIAQVIGLRPESLNEQPVWLCIMGGIDVSFPMYDQGWKPQLQVGNVQDVHYFPNVQFVICVAGSW